MLLGAVDLLGAPLATGAARRRYALAGTGFVVSGVLATAVQVEPWLGWCARVLPIDRGRHVHRLALVLSLLLVLTQLVTQLTTDVLAVQATAGTSLSRTDLILQELPFLLAAVAGVGLGIRRGPRATLRRLGLVRPEPWQLAIALGAAGAFYAFGVGMDQLGQALTPNLAHRVEAATNRLFAHLTDPLGVVTIAVAAGVCEETLFRGALQPRLGLLWVAIVFTSVHTQYGLSVDTVAVLILACGLGFVRRFANTTTSMLCHVTYNGLVGFGVGWIGVGPALGVEAALLVAAAVAYLRTRRPVARATS
jgi:CAAX protease family protein